MKLLAIALGLLAVPTLVLAQCPFGNTLISGSAGQSLQVDSSDPTKSFDGSPVVPGAPCIACYSWPAGFFRVSGGAPADWISLYGGSDLFQLTGPDGPEISFIARLRVTGSMSANASGLAGLTSSGGKGTSVSLNVNGGETVSNQVIALDLNVFPGDPFNLAVDLVAHSDVAYTSGDLQAWLEFVNLPSGYAISSCEGYDVPVPTVPETWGKLRASYR